jgi:DNA-binding PadR family transcriptional regulator
MARRATSTREAVEQTASVAEARAAVGAPTAGPGGADPLVGELRRAGLLPLLVLHFAAAGPCYGNQLMERISELTAGTLAVNPNTMYPLLRALEARGLVAGEWEHPERRSRRFYRITPAGEAERERLARELLPRLDAVAASIESIRAEVGSS